MPDIRPYRPSDRWVLYDICVRTADAGSDARGQYSTDDLMGDLFAGPYAELEPELAFVADDGGRAVGYVLGTANTAAFVRHYADKWLPYFAERYPPPPPAPRTPEQDMVALGFHPERMILTELAAYPAHLHIDLLPDHQGRGLGRRLIERFLTAAAEAGATGVHVCMLRSNVKARGFYDRLGFVQLDVPDPGPVDYLGLPLPRG